MFSKKILSFFNGYKIKIIICVLAFIFGSACSLIQPLLTQKAIDDGIVLGNLSFLLKIVIIYLLVGLLKECIITLANKKLSLYSGIIISNMQKFILTKQMKKSYISFSNNSSGYINSRISEVWNIETIFSPTIISGFINSLEFFGALIIFVTVDLRLTLLVCIPIPLVFLTIKTLIQKMSKTINSSFEQSAEMKSDINQMILGYEDVSYFNMQNILIEKINCKSRKFAKTNMEISFLSSLLNQTTSIVLLIVSAIVLWFGGGLVVENSLTIGTYIALTSYAYRLYAPVTLWISFMDLFQKTKITVDRIDEFLSDCSDQENEISKIDLANKSIDIISKIQFEKVSYKYDDNIVLNNLSFTVTSKQVVLVKGKNGAGKTTIFRLLCGLIKPTSGQIFINNKNVDIIENIMDRISVINQVPFLFTGSLQDNIVLNTPFNETRYKNILQQCDLVDIGQTISEGGSDLSGGQVKKVSIARALYKPSSVILFDESTTHLDTDAVNIVKKIVSDLKERHIIFIIDHTNQFDEIADIELTL